MNACSVPKPHSILQAHTHPVCKRPTAKAMTFSKAAPTCLPLAWSRHVLLYALSPCPHPLNQKQPSGGSPLPEAFAQLLSSQGLSIPTLPGCLLLLSPINSAGSHLLQVTTTAPTPFYQSGLRHWGPSSSQQSYFGRTESLLSISGNPRITTTRGRNQACLSETYLLDATGTPLVPSSISCWS